MKSRSAWSLSAVSLLGLGVGLAAGAAAGLLAAPMRGADMRRSLRSRADDAVDRGMALLEEGRRAFRTSDPVALAPAPRSSSATLEGGTLSASLGEIAQMHSPGDVPFTGGRS